MEATFGMSLLVRLVSVVGKFLRDFSKKNLDLNNSKHMFHVHLLFREHFAFMLKKLH